MDKIKEFLKNKWVKLAAWILALISDAVLILGGTSVTDIGNGAELVVGIIGAIGLLIAFISGKLKKE